MSHSQSKSSSSSMTTSNPISLQDVEGLQIIGNSGPVAMPGGNVISGNRGDVAITDGGAIQGSLGLAGAVMEQAAALTMGLVRQQAEAGKDALASLQESAGKSYQFAMDAGRSDIKLMQDGGRMLLIVAGIAAGAWVLHGWGK